MRVSLIVATGPSGVIGQQGEIPWHLPADLAHFKRTTMGHPIIMGRKTFESIGRPLPGRRNLVLSRNPELLGDGVEGYATPDEVLNACQGETEVFIIGGSEIYALFLSQAQLIYRTEVFGDFVGDAFFPALEPDQWKLISSQNRSSDEKNPHSCSFQLFERVEVLDGSL